MGFLKKIWKDRVSERPQRRILTNVDTNEEMTVDVTRFEGMVVQEGDAFSANNMNDLENRIKTAMDSTDATVNTVNTKANTNAENIASLQNAVNSVSGRVTTNTNNISSLSGRVTNVENATNANAGNISNLNSKVDRVEHKANTNTDSINGLTVRMTDVENLATNLNNGKAPNDHASTTTKYGKGSDSLFGHVKISDATNNAGSAYDGVAASSKAVADGIQISKNYTDMLGGVVNDHHYEFANELTANNVRIYMDYQNGRYGYNTSANRGADTFHPFNTVDGSLEIRVELHAEVNFTEEDRQVDARASSWANIYMNGQMVNTGSITAQAGGSQSGHNEEVDTKTYHLSDWNIN